MAAGILLIVVGLWLVLQTVAADLPGRLLALAGAD